MNEKFALHFRIFTRADLSEVAGVQRLVKRFADDALFHPDRWGATEPAKAAFDAKDLAAPAKALSVEGNTLILAGKAPRWLAYLNWQAKRKHPWFWTLDLSKDFLDPDKTAHAAEFVTALCEEADAVFAAGALVGDWFEKHDVLDTKGKLARRVGASFEIGTGLPGVYWYNFLGKQARETLDFDAMRSVEGVEMLADNAEHAAWLTYKSPDAESAAWRREREAACVEALGSAYFFDLAAAASSRPRRRKPIALVTDAKSLRG